eukprot:Colp12_sorted_trinity150504_noHs@34935
MARPVVPIVGMLLVTNGQNQTSNVVFQDRNIDRNIMKSRKGQIQNVVVLKEVVDLMAKEEDNLAALSVIHHQRNMTTEKLNVKVKEVGKRRIQRQPNKKPL